MIALEIPPTQNFIQNENMEIVLNEEHVKNFVIFENQPRKNKVFNSNKLDINRVLPLIDKFINDFKINFRQFEEVKFETVISAFAKTISKILLYNPDKIGVELTKSGTLYVYSVISNYKIHFEIFFNHNIDDEPFECVVNMFENRSLVLNKNGGFSEVIKEMEELIPVASNEELYLNYINNNSSYGISSRFITEDWI